MKHLLRLAAALLIAVTCSLAGDPAPESPLRNATYSGIIGADKPSDRGSIKITTTTAGRYTFFARFGGRKLSHKGPIAADGTVSDSFTMKLYGGLVQIPVKLDFAVAPDGESISGTATANGTVIPFLLYEAYPYTAADPAPQAGTFTALIRPTTEGFPGGTGVASLKVSIKGAVRIAGRLADGARISCGGNLSQSGVFPVYNLLYGRKGGLSGFPQFSSPDAGMGTLMWMRPEGANVGAAFPGAYTGEVTIDVVRYTKPAMFTPVLSFGTEGNIAPFLASGGGLLNDVSGQLSISTTNKVLPVGENAVTLKLEVNKKTGRIEGSMILSIGETTRKRSIYLVARQGTSEAEGFFIGAGDSGTFRVRVEESDAE